MPIAAAMEGGRLREEIAMTTKEIRISNLEEVKQVVSVASVSPLGVEAVDSRGHVADASSILGMLALDYQHPVEVRSRDEDSLREICTRLKKRPTC